jgi:2-dehydropantoate 2-reductase
MDATGEWTPRSWAVVGSGAVGLYYGGRLAEHGHDVRFLTRGDHDAIARDGIRVTSPDGDFHLPRPVQSRDPSELGPVDVVIVAIKTTANGALPALLPPLLHDDSVVVTLQNGLGNEECLAAIAGMERVMGALCFICLNRVAPGVVHHIGAGPLSLGEPGRPPGPRARAIAAAWVESGVRAAVVENLALERWRKLVWNVPFNGLTVAAGGVPVDALLRDTGLRAEVWSLMREVQAGAAAQGFLIPDRFLELQIERTLPMGEYRPSSLIDFQRGHALEVESIWGEPMRRAEAAGVPVPRLRLLHALLTALDPARPR